MSTTTYAFNKKQILGTFITLGSYQSFINRLVAMAKNNLSAYVCVANVHMLMEAHKSKSFADLLNDADIVTPDGMPLSLGIKLLYGAKQDRVAGMDLMPSLLHEAVKNELGIFFYGSTSDVLLAIKKRCTEEFPSLKISGIYSPPFRPLSKEEEEIVIDRINASGASIVFVALGCPKQEKWMAAMKGRVQAVMIGLGGAFPVFAGIQARAPYWMRKYSLEWAFRLSQEPGRLYKRYFVTNTMFLVLFFKELVSKKIFHKYNDLP